MNQVIESQPMQKACCANCLFGNLEQIQGQLMRMLVCHGAPPNTFAIQTPQGIQQVTTFPVVQPAMWCGFHTFKHDATLETQIVEG